MVLLDLLSQYAPVMVNEKSATRILKQGYRIGVRVVAERNHRDSSGASLPFSVDAFYFLVDGLRDALKPKMHDSQHLIREQLQGCGPRPETQPFLEYISPDPEGTAVPIAGLGA